MSNIARLSDIAERPRGCAGHRSLTGRISRSGERRHLEIATIFIDEQDRRTDPAGVKGLGETSMVGIAAAIANAVWHATGIQVRELSIIIEKLLV